MYRQLTFIGITLLTVSCAALPPGNPWQTPNRGHSTLDDGVAELNSLMQPCIKHARDTFPEATRRFKSGLPKGTEFAVIARNDQKANFFIRVNDVEDNQVHGMVANRGSQSVNGRQYSSGQKVSIFSKDIVDWYIIKPDLPGDGNLLGKYLLLREDGLAPGACDPNHIEAQHSRIFRKYYSFVPPSGEGWQMQGVGKGLSVSMENVIGKPNQAYSFFTAHSKAQVYASAQSLANSTREMEKTNLEATDPVKILRHEVNLYEKKQAKCVRMHQLYEVDKRLPAGFGNQGPVTNEILTLKCIHPQSQNMAIWLVYSHLYEPGHRNPKFDDQAEKLFESLGFTGQNTNHYLPADWWKY